MCAILHHFEYTSEITSVIVHRKIDDVKEHLRLVNPEFSLILLPITELLDNLLNDMYALTRVTVGYFATNDILRTREYSMVSVRIELHQFMLIYERDVYW